MEIKRCAALDFPGAVISDFTIPAFDSSGKSQMKFRVAESRFPARILPDVLLSPFLPESLSSRNLFDGRNILFTQKIVYPHILNQERVERRGNCWKLEKKSSGKEYFLSLELDSARLSETDYVLLRAELMKILRNNLGFIP